jgi:soluble lytic murein transglycosylase
MFWLAKTMDRSGRDDDAFAAYMRLADSSPGSPLADDSLLAAYFIRKFQNRGADYLTLLRRLESDFPRSILLRTACWEIALQSYERGDFKTAAVYFKKILDDKNRREKALYWYSRTLAAAGDKEGAEKALASLAAEYPFGFYALTLAKNSPIRVEGILASEDIRALLPEPSCFDRAKILISLGLFEDSRKELAWLKRRSSNDSGALSAIARLYLKMGDFHGSSTKIKTEGLRSMDKNSLAEWGMAYPLAYREHVTANALKNGIAEGVVYSIMRAESNFSPTAVSPSGAVGLMQIMPATAKAIVNSETGNGYGIGELLRRPEVNIRLGVKHIRGLLDSYNGDLVLSVAAYNAGSGNVERWLKSFGKLPKDLFIEKIPFPETREYVKKVLTGIEIYKRIYNLPSTKLPEDRTSASSPPPAASPFISRKQ